MNEYDYWRLLTEASLIIDLTDMDNCLVCGAYEAISIEKPLILSKNNASVQTFNKNAVHVENTSESIKIAILDVIGNYSRYKKSASDAKNTFLIGQQKRIECFRKIIVV